MSRNIRRVLYHLLAVLTVSSQLTGFAYSAPTNLINNGSFETAGTAGNPAGWVKQAWGSHGRTFTYPAVGRDGGRAAGIQVTSYPSGATGNSGWQHDDVEINPGTQYTYSEWSTSTTNTIVLGRILMSNGSHRYIDVLNPIAATPAWTFRSSSFVAPAGAVSITLMHLIAASGNLAIDDVSLVSGSEAPPQPPTPPSQPPPPTSGNLIQNPSLETEGTGGNPSKWLRGGWGNNNREFTYPVEDAGDGKAVRVDITSYTTGAANWYFADVPVTAGVSYSFGFRYKSTATTGITYQFTKSDGSLSYKGTADVRPSGSWTSFSESVVPPSGTVSMTALVTLNSVGSFTSDDYVLTRGQGSPPPPPPPPPSNPPPSSSSKGLVTLTFDDGLISQYTDALPILRNAGMSATFYIISDRGGSGYMNDSQVLALQSAGHELAAHTRMHPHLLDLSTSQQQAEVAGSRNDLLNLGANSVTAFAYPFGEYDNALKTVVRNAGFTNARTSDWGFNTKYTDKYALKIQQIDRKTTVAQIRAWVNQAIADKTWLILMFHQINNDTTATYGTTRDILQQTVNYIGGSGASVITMKQGVAWQNQ